LRTQGEAHTRPKHNILDSEITIGSFLWPNGFVMVEINHNMLMISCDEKKYSSNTLNRTGENNCMNHSQGSNDVLPKNFMCE